MLTREDIQALRKADEVYFYSAGGRNWIRALIGSFRNTQVYSKSEQLLFPGTVGVDSGRHREIEVESASLRTYETKRPTKYSAYTGFINRARMHTIFRALKVGDTLNFQWVMNNNNENIKSVGFHRDELILEAAPEKGAKSSWLIAVQVGPDNSSRMIQAM